MRRYRMPLIAPPPPPLPEVLRDTDVEKQLLRQIAQAEQQKQEAVFTLEALRRGHLHHQNVATTLR